MNAMTFEKLHTELLSISKQYIVDAKKFQRSFFAFMTYLTEPYRNMPQAIKLHALLQKDKDVKSLMSEIVTICQNISCSSHLLPAIAMAIVKSHLFPQATERFHQIAADIAYINAYNDGGASRCWETSDFLSILRAAQPLLPEIEMVSFNRGLSLTHQ